MNKGVAKLLTIAFPLVLAITATFTANAFYSYKGEKKPENNRSWLLQPNIFDHLSSSGKQAALFVNGLLKIETGHQSLGMPEREVSPQVSPEENVRVNNPGLDRGGHTQSESTIAVNGSTIVVSFNDNGSLSFLLRDINFSSYALSTNGGINFTQKRIPTLFKGFNLGDGVVAFGPNGELYYSTLAFTETGKSIIGVAKSVDGGFTFTTPIDASTTAGNTQDFQDKDWIAVDRGSDSPFKGNVYVSWTSFISSNQSILINFSRSTNGGATFGAPVALSTKGNLVQGSMPAVAPNGDLYVAYEDRGLNSSNGGIEPDDSSADSRLTSISIVKSTDGGNTFSAPKTVARFNSISFTKMTGGNGVRVFSFPSITVDKNGVVHIVYAAASALFRQDRSDIFYARSTDGGMSFSAPLKLNDDGTTTTQVNPSITAAANGTLGVKWWDRRNDPVNDSLTDVYMTISTDGGASFSKNFRITNHNWAFGPKEPFIADAYHGDYDTIAADSSSFYLSWSDERNGNPDVYFTQIPINRSPNIPDFNISTAKLFDSVIAGNSVDFDFKTSNVNGFSEDLTLSVVSPGISGISGLTYNFDSPVIASGQSAKLTISTTADARPGTYLITVVANGLDITRKTNFHLTVLDPLVSTGLPVNITNTPGFSRINSGLQIDANGAINLVFEDDTAVAGGGIGGEVFFTQSLDGGKTYSKPVKVSTNSPISSDSSLVLDSDGNPYIVWASRDEDNKNSTVFISKSKDRGKSFSPPAAISTAPQNAGSPSIAIDKSGNILMAFTALGTSGSSGLFVVRSTDGGESFSTPLQITPDTEGIPASQVAFNSKGTAYILYNEASTAQGVPTVTMNLLTATDGEHFDTPNRISLSPKVLDFSPHLAFDRDDNMYVALARGNTDIVLIKSTNGGKSFSRPVNISNNVGSSHSPSVILDMNGNVNVVWDDDTPDRINPDILFARSTDGGLTFSQPINLSSNFGVSIRPTIASDSNGNLLVAWTDDSPANSDVFVSSLLFFKPQPAIITGFSPISGTVGSDITIFGSNFQNTTAITFSDNVLVSPSNFTVSADGTQISTKVPQGAQTGPIAVTTPSGTAVSSAVFTVTAGDFALAIDPASQTVAPGASTSFTVNVQAAGGFTEAVSLSAAVTPIDSSVTTSLLSSSVNPGGSTTLTVNTTAGTAANNFVITVTGRSGQTVHVETATVNVVVPDFALVFNPEQLTVSRGQKGEFTVSINRTGGFTGNVTVTAPNTKAIKIKLSPPSASTTGTSVSFNFIIKKSAPTGVQQIVFTGRDDSGRARTATLTLMVQ